MELHQRLEIFFERLRIAPPARNATEALALLSRLIEEVEDEFCEVPRRDPPPKEPTGRMYAPQADSVRRVSSGQLRVRTARHLILCDPDGAIRIESIRKRHVELLKPGVKT